MLTIAADARNPSTPDEAVWSHLSASS